MQRYAWKLKFVGRFVATVATIAAIATIAQSARAVAASSGGGVTASGLADDVPAYTHAAAGGT